MLQPDLEIQLAPREESSSMLDRFFPSMVAAGIALSLLLFGVLLLLVPVRSRAYPRRAETKAFGKPKAFPLISENASD